MSKKGKTKSCTGYRGKYYEDTDSVKIFKCNAESKEPDVNFCTAHQYMSALNAEDFEGIKGGNWCMCERCFHFIENNGEVSIKECNICKEKSKKRRDARKDAMSEAKKEKKCKWFDHEMKPCMGNKWNDNTEYCKYHQYVNNYTDKQKDDIKLCTTCRKIVRNETLCDTDQCKKRRANIKIKKKDDIIKCKREGCTYKVKENGYCGKHWLSWWKEDAEKDGTKKVCSNYTRKCRTILDIDYKYARCDNCRSRERQQDQIKRDIDKGIVPKYENNKICSNCTKEKIKTDFINNNGIEYKKCNHCREFEERVEAKKNGRKR
jgi:hypothetical protein